MEIDNDIVYNVLNGFKRKEIGKQAKAKFIREAMKELKLSNRKFAVEFNIPLTTLKDWLVFDKITEEDYQGYLDKGLSNTDLFRTLRNTKQDQVKIKLNQQVYDGGKPQISHIDDDLKTCISLISKHLMSPKKTRDTEDLVIELQHMLVTIRRKIQ